MKRRGSWLDSMQIAGMAVIIAMDIRRW